MTLTPRASWGGSRHGFSGVLQHAHYVAAVASGRGEINVVDAQPLRLRVDGDVCGKPT